MDIGNLKDIEINQFEYCIVAEKTYLPAETVKVTIPKLSVKTGKAKIQVNNSILVNSGDYTGGIVGYNNTGTIKAINLNNITYEAFFTQFLACALPVPGSAPVPAHAGSRG